jgi:hypothetical protein
VEKLKQYDKRVFVVGGRQFTSGILQRNCHEFIAYENLLQVSTGGDTSRTARAARSTGRGSTEVKALASAVPNIQRALKILAEREVAPQLGLLKSTMLQLDATFTERDYGAGSFLEFIRKLEKENLVQAHKTDRGYLVETVETEGAKEPVAKEPLPKEAVPSEPMPEVAEPVSEIAPEWSAPPEAPAPAPAPPSAPKPAPEPSLSAEETFALLKRALSSLLEKGSSRPIYMRQVRQAMRLADPRFDERLAGFRGLLDLLHQAQREGWLRLHRDRKGVWRVFPVSTEAAAEVAPVPVEPAPLPEFEMVADTETAPPETDVLWEVAESSQLDEMPALEPPPPADLPASEEPAAAQVVAEAAPEPAPQPEPDKKTRKPRPARRSPRSRTSQRKTTTRRKPKVDDLPF